MEDFDVKALFIFGYFTRERTLEFMRGYCSGSGLKVAMDESVDLAAVLLGAMRFGNTVSVNSSVSPKGKTARAATIPAASAKRSEEGRADVSGGFGVGNGVHDSGGENNVGSQFNDASPAGMRGTLRQDPQRSSNVYLNGDRNVDSDIWPPLGTGNRQANQRCGGDGPSGGGTTQAPSPMFSQGPFSATSSNVSAMSAEQEKAEKVFDSFNRSGRVSTRAFEDLLNLLEVPVKRRKGDATESARAAGLLNACSFSRKDFIDWYLAWCLQKRKCEAYSPAGAASRVRASAAGSANDVRDRATFSAPQTLPKFDARRRSNPAMNSPSSSDSEVSFSVKAAAASRAAVAAASASPDPTDSSDHATRREAGGGMYMKKQSVSGCEEELTRLRDLNLDGGKTSRPIATCEEELTRFQDLKLDGGETSTPSATSAHGKRGSSFVGCGNPDPNRQNKASHSSTNGPNDERTNVDEARISNVGSGVSTSEDQKVSEGDGNAWGIASPAPSGQASPYPSTFTGTDSLPQAQPSRGPIKSNSGTKVRQAASTAPSPRQQGRSGGGVTSDRGPRILRGFAGAGASASRKERDTSAASVKLASSETRSTADMMDVSEHPPSDPGIRGPGVSFSTGQPDKSRPTPARKTATPIRKTATPARKTETSASKRVREEKERREKAAELLTHLRDKHNADAERARRAYMSKNFEVAVVEYTAAITSLDAIVSHVGRHSVVAAVVVRKRLAPFFYERACSVRMLGRLHSAAADCALALAADADFLKACPQMGKALLLAGELKQAEDAFRLGMRENTDCEEDERHDKDCRLGMSDVRAVSAHLENAKRAVERKDNTNATDCAKRALNGSPNLEAAQKLLVGVLMAEKKWEEARCRCEVWAYKLESCRGANNMMPLQGYAEGGGPPRLCLRAMHATIRQEYVKSLRNTGRMDAFKGALDEATGMGLAWAKDMTCQRQEAMEKKFRAGQAYAAGRYHLAQDLYTEAIGIDQEDVRTNALLYANRAAALMNLGKNKDALKDCEQALRLNPNYREVLLMKARLLSRLRFWQEAAKTYILYLGGDVWYGEELGAYLEYQQVLLHIIQVREQCRREEERRREEEHRHRQEEEANARSRSRDWGYYDTLGLEPSATTAQVKKAYRKLALQHHPDKNQGDAAAGERFKEVNAAYEVLSDESERRAHDAYLRSLAC